MSFLSRRSKRWLVKIVALVLVQAGGLLWVWAAIWGLGVLDPGAWWAWAVISYGSVALLCFVLLRALGSGSGPLDFDLRQAVLASLGWLFLALLVPVVGLFVLGAGLTFLLMDRAWSRSKVGQALERWWSSRLKE